MRTQRFNFLEQHVCVRLCGQLQGDHTRQAGLEDATVMHGLAEMQ